MARRPVVIATLLLLHVYVSDWALAEERWSADATDKHVTDAMLHTIGSVFRMAPHVREPKIAEDTATVATTSGEVTGALFDDSTVFYGIPYAEKPVRFRESRLREARESIDASEPKKVRCFQPCNDKCRQDGDTGFTEDCLIVNVYVPRQLKKKGDDLLPVLFWIHGGAFYQGSGTDSVYDGHWLSRITKSVVVTINYRLGALGFFTYLGEGLSGHQGIGDQQLALQWVHRNIEQFGGDKSQVTIFGESAGGQSVMFHLVWKKSAPYFKRAIMQSNPAVARYRTEDETQDNTDLILKETNCNSLKCLQELPAETIVDLHSKVSLSHLKIIPSSFQSLSEAFVNVIEPFRPVTGGIEFPVQPMALLHHGRWNIDKEVIVGHTADEMSVFLAVLASKLQENEKTSAGVFRALLHLLKNLLSEWIRAADPDFDIEHLEADAKDFVQSVLTTYVFSCPSRNLARYLAVTTEKQGRVFFYNFNYGPSAEFLEAIHLPQSLAGKAFHGSELSFLFGNSPRGYTFTDDDLTMRDMLNSFWGNFSLSGMPDSADGTQWPSYTRSLSGLTTWPYVELDVPESNVAYDQGYDLCDVLNAFAVYSNIDPPLDDVDPSKDEL